MSYCVECRSTDCVHAKARERIAGYVVLSEREVRITKMLMADLNSKEIAYHLGITYGSAASSITHLRNKLNLRRMAEIAEWGAQHFGNS